TLSSEQRELRERSHKDIIVKLQHSFGLYLLVGQKLIVQTVTFTTDNLWRGGCVLISNSKHLYILTNKTFQQSSNCLKADAIASN
ncbi:hypothetical protein GBAR_LOCUS4119, partial [Geodia barretti]